MALDVNLKGTSTGTAAFVGSGSDLLKVATELNSLSNPNNVGDINIFSEVDHGYTTGTAKVLSPEVDADFRLRVAPDLLYDEENFNYTAQNTGKYGATSTTMAATFAAGTVTLNSGSITTTTTGYQLFSYAFFPFDGASTVSADFELGFSAQPTANVFVEFGLGLSGATATTIPTDGVFFRLTSAGLQGIASNNGTETSTGVFTGPGGAGTFTYNNSQKYQFIVYMSAVEASFWVNDGVRTSLLGSIQLPTGQQRLCMASAGQWFVKQRITGGAAGAAFQTLLGALSVRAGGTNTSTTPTIAGNRKYGSYQGLSGGTMGSLATYPNSTNPTAATPSNTALTANLPAGLGGQGAVNAAAAAATDGIWGEYAVPAGTVNVPGRRLVIRGVKVSLVNLGVAVATTATTIQFSLAFGHTAVSMATAEAASAKAPRRIALGIATWPIGAPVGAMPDKGDITLDLGDCPIFVNPGERVALVGKFLAGTATASQVINFTWTPVYGWE